jgi:regulator of PEP synthase PpsR (kinase-PPPase family)
VWAVSDGTGRTAMAVVRAAIYQFSREEVDFRVAGNVTTGEQITDLVEKVRKESGMIVYTIVSSPLRRLLHRLTVENHILAVDLFGPLITTMEKFFETVPLETPGLSFKLNRDYYRMVDAVDFTIRHDDGRGVEDVEAADIVLIGPSRVGKTPLAVYLAYMGWKTANIPVLLGIPMPVALDRIRFKVFSLVVSADILRKRRIDRLRKISAPQIEGYTEIREIERELQYGRELSEHGRKWAIVDMSDRTVEDVSKEIVRLLHDMRF